MLGCAAPTRTPTYVVPTAVATTQPVATIRATTSAMYSCYVTWINTKGVNYPKQGLGFNYSEPIAIKPGNHRITAIVEGGGGPLRWGFSHTFKAGHAYRVDRVGAFDNRILLIDETDNKTHRVRVDGPDGSMWIPQYRARTYRTGNDDRPL